MPKALTLLLDLDDQYRRAVQQSHAFLHRRDRRFAHQQAEHPQPTPVPPSPAAPHAPNGPRRQSGAGPPLRPSPPAARRAGRPPRRRSRPTPTPPRRAPAAPPPPALPFLNAVMTAVFNEFISRR